MFYWVPLFCLWSKVSFFRSINIRILFIERWKYSSLILTLLRINIFYCFIVILIKMLINEKKFIGILHVFILNLRFIFNLLLRSIRQHLFWCCYRLLSFSSVAVLLFIHYFPLQFYFVVSFVFQNGINLVILSFEWVDSISIDVFFNNSFSAYATVAILMSIKRINLAYVLIVLDNIFIWRCTKHNFPPITRLSIVWRFLKLNVFMFRLFFSKLCKSFDSCLKILFLFIFTCSHS